MMLEAGMVCCLFDCASNHTRSMSRISKRHRFFREFIFRSFSFFHWVLSFSFDTVSESLCEIFHAQLTNMKFNNFFWKKSKMERERERVCVAEGKRKKAKNTKMGHQKKSSTSCPLRLPHSIRNISTIGSTFPRLNFFTTHILVGKSRFWSQKVFDANPNFQ